jgi:hypothetical protein
MGFYWAIDRTSALSTANRAVQPNWHAGPNYVRPHVTFGNNHFWAEMGANNTRGGRLFIHAASFYLSTCPAFIRRSVENGHATCPTSIGPRGMLAKLTRVLVRHFMCQHVPLYDWTKCPRFTGKYFDQWAPGVRTGMGLVAIHMDAYVTRPV